MLQDVSIDREPTSSNATSHAVQANWGPAETAGNHNQGRPETSFRITSLWLRSWTEVNVSNEFAQERRARSASVRDAISPTGDTD